MSFQTTLSIARKNLRLDDEEIAQQLGVAVERIREAVATVQRLEPAGIAARSLQECFLLQIERLPRDDRAELLDLIRRLETVDVLLGGDGPHPIQGAVRSALESL